MSGRWMLVLGMTLAMCASLADAAWAQRRGSSPTISPVPLRAAAVARSDLVCQLYAAEDPDLNLLIADGESTNVANGGSVWVWALVYNSSAVEASTFTTRIMVKRDLELLPPRDYGPVTLAAWSGKQLPPFEIKLNTKHNEISAEALADVGHYVAESKEGNNNCKIAFEANLVQ